MPTVYVDTSDLKNLAKDLEKCPQMLHAATAAALNRTLTFIGAETKRQVAKEYAVKKSISKSVKKTRATPRNLTAVAEYTGKPIPVFVFKHSIAKNRQRSPVTVTIKTSNGARTHDGSNPAMFGGYGKVMRREGGQKNIRTAYTVSIPQMISSDEVFKVIAEKAQAKLYERMKHEVEWRMSKL